jgi:hypothetical protein
MTLNLSEIFGIQAALARLTNYTQVVKDQTVVTPFHFSGKTRWNISKNLRICEDAAKPWQKVLDGLKEQFKITADTKNDDPVFLEFQKEAEKTAAETKDEYNFLKIPLAELTDDKNPVSADVLGVLDRYELIQE